MKKTLLQIALAIFFVSTLTAQADKCFTDQLVNKKYQSDSAYARQFDAWRNSIVQLAQQQQIGTQRGALYTIPIVFHVILNSQQTLNSVTDAAIQTQLATLNKDFRKLNSDTTTIRTVFKPIASDIEIQFCLAQRDPNGNSTTGITRTLTSHGAWDPSTEGDDMKFTASGGINAWQPTKYLNVWIVDIVGSVNGGTAGYAYVGGGGSDGSSVDGIVLDFQIGFGSNERSLTHEVGHYMGLLHTWGTANSCSNDDGIADTPESFTSNFGCDYSENSCTSGNPDLPDQIENYMDYSSCPAMFTVQQKTVMRSVLTGSRSSLLTSTGCQAVNSAPTANFYASATTVCTGSTIAFIDNSTNGAISWAWSFPGGTPSSSTLQNPSVTYATAGTYNVTLIATNGFGSDTETKSNYITAGIGIATTIFSENFEGNTATWSSVNPDAGLTWEVVAGIAGSLPGDRAARVHIFDYDAAGQRDGLVSPVISLVNKTQVSLTFNYAHRRYSQNEHDSLIVYVSTNGGTSYTRVYANAEDNLAGASFATGTIYQGDFVPADAVDWCAASATGVTCPVINLNAYSGQANFRIKFEIYNDFGNNIYIDNIALTGVCSGAVGQAPTANFTTNNTSGCNAVSVTFSDQSTNSPTSWSWQFTGGTPSTSTQQNPTVSYSAPGTYNVTLTATNTNGADAETKSSYITVLASPTSSSTFVNASCPGINTGSVNLSVSGGASPYTYLWSNGATTQDLSNIAGGTYTVTITDANTCTATGFTTVGNGIGPIATVSAFDASCSGVNNGLVDLSVTSGTSPYTYVWSTGSTSQDLSSIASGTYTVTVTDANGCTAGQTGIVGKGSSLQLSVSIHADSMNTGTGSVLVTVSEGTAPYGYLWSTGSTSVVITGLNVGNYSVTVTDVNGCEASGIYTVANDTTGNVSSGQTIDLSYSIYPNPADGLLNVQVSAVVSGEIRLRLYNAIGQKVMEQSYSNALAINAIMNVSILEEGIYFLRLENNSKTAVSRIVVMRN